MSIDPSKMRTRGFIGQQAMSPLMLAAGTGTVELDPITVLNQFCRVLNCTKPAQFTLISEEPLESKSAAAGEPPAGGGPAHLDSKRIGARNIVFEVRHSRSPVLWRIHYVPYCTRMDMCFRVRHVATIQMLIGALSVGYSSWIHGALIVGTRLADLNYFPLIWV